MSEQLIMRENTAHDLADGDRVVAANFWDRDYDTAGGETANGLTAQLLFSSGRREFVGEGSALELGGRTWRVTGVAPRQADGWARLTLESD